MRHHLISWRVLAWVGAIVAWGTLAPLQPLHAQKVTLRAETPTVAPEWALLQRELLRSGSIAMERFAERYFDERGYLLADLRWGMNDGPDDAIENINRWPEMYALGTLGNVGSWPTRGITVMRPWTASRSSTCAATFRNQIVASATGRAKPPRGTRCMLIGGEFGAIFWNGPTRISTRMAGCGACICAGIPTF